MPNASSKPSLSEARSSCKKTRSRATTAVSLQSLNSSEITLNHRFCLIKLDIYMFFLEISSHQSVADTYKYVYGSN